MIGRATFFNADEVREEKKFGWIGIFIPNFNLILLEYRSSSHLWYEPAKDQAAIWSNDARD